MGKHWRVALIGAVLAAVFILITGNVWLAGAVTLNMLVPEGAWRPLAYMTRAPGVHDASVESLSGRTLTVRSYEPRQWFGMRPRGGVVIYTPFIGGGLDDARLVNLADTLARGGFVVAVPWREEERLMVSERDAEDVVSTVQHVAQQSSGQVGLFGISYGTGPVFAAAADDRVREMIPFVVSLNGYADLANVIAFIRTGDFSYKDFNGHVEPHSYPREIMEATERAGVELAALRDLSPIAQLPDMSATLFVIHSVTDTFIPFTESLRLHEAALEHGLASQLLLTELVDHGTYRPLTIETARRYYLPAAASFYGMVFDLIWLV